MFRIVNAHGIYTQIRLQYKFDLNVSHLFLWVLDIFCEYVVIFQRPVALETWNYGCQIFRVKFRYSEKTTRFEKIFHLKFDATQ